MEKPRKQMGEQFVMLTQVHSEVGARTAEFLRQRHPQNTVKLVARELDAPVDTVKGWVEKRRMPQNNRFLQMVASYGEGFLNYVLAPCGVIGPKEFNARMAISDHEQTRISRDARREGDYEN